MDNVRKHLKNKHETHWTGVMDKPVMMEMDQTGWTWVVIGCERGWT